MNTPSLTSIVICADDYGLAPGVNTAIRALIEQGRISATSCMPLFAQWEAEAEMLKPLAEQADIGLHLTLTDHPPLGPMPELAANGHLPDVGALMKRAYLRGLPKAEIAAELERQLNAFTQIMGRSPDFIDGHQHIHQLPGVREVVAALLKRLPGTYVRLCHEPMRQVLTRAVAIPKTVLISELARPFTRQVHRQGIPANRGFRGVYDFSDKIPFLDLIERFLTPVVPGALIMVHPGHPDDHLAARDRVVAQREVEYRALASPAFADLLARHAVAVRRFAQTLGQIPS